MVNGFKLVGVDGVEVNSIEEAWKALSVALARRDLAIIIISTEFSTEPPVKERIARVRVERKTPLIVEIQGSKGKKSEVPISDVMSKTIGIKI